MTHRFIEEARGRLDESVELIEELARIESPTDDPTAVDRVIERLVPCFDSRGFRVRRIVGRAERTGAGTRASAGQILAVPRERERGRPIQLMVGHLDTVWPLGTLPEMPVTRKHGRLHGPGVFDMKSGVVQGLMALDVLRATGTPPAATPVFFLNTDEETGSDDSRHQVVRLGRVAARAFVLEPSFGPAGLVKTARKGVMRFRVVAHGRPAHAGLDPGAGASAIEAMARLVPRLHGMTDPEAGTTVNVGRILGGTRPNVVAARCEVQIDVRVVSAEAAADLDGRIRALESDVEGVRLEIDGDVQCPPMERTPRNRALWENARGVAAQLGIEIDDVEVGGGSDGNTLSLYTATLDGLGAVGDGAHAAHEHVQIDRIPERVALLAGLLASPMAR